MTEDKPKVVVSIGNPRRRMAPGSMPLAVLAAILLREGIPVETTPSPEQPTLPGERGRHTVPPWITRKRKS